MAPSAEAQEPKPTSARPGTAGRINYDQWDKVTRTLVDDTEQEEQREEEASKKALGLDGKYAQSQADADERKKASEVLKAKKVLDNYKKRESAVRADLKGILGPPPSTDKESSTDQEESKSTEPKIVRITREQMDAGKRVVVISDTSGASQSDTVVLTSDLSLLESKMKTNSTTVPKKYADDAENDVVEPTPNSAAAERKIYGVIKCFLSNVHNCTILIKCKVISGTLEMGHCSNVVVKIERDATVATIQADLCEDISIIFNDAPSGKNGTTNAAGIPVDTSANSKNRIYWGQDKEDRIFHAGVKNMKVQINRDGYLETERICDYTKDGAKAVGNATEEEFQFVTSCLDDELVTEAVVREGSTTGQNARPLTKRELEEEKAKREKAEKMAVNMAENMIKFKEVNKDGAKKATRTDQKVNKSAPVVEDVEEEVEEIFASMSKEDIDAVVKECEQNKARGNEAFGSGEYAQAILLYSLALDKADELPDDKNDKTKKQLFARDVTLSNRAASFLKLGQHEKAAADAKLAHEYNDKNVKAFFRHGLALHAMKEYKEAISILAQAHKLEPKNKSIKEALQFAEMRLNQDLRKRMQG
jgi:tetratricopeptide (TPR) repeat protein